MGLPVAKTLKFSAVLGTVSLNNSMKIVPAGIPSTVISKNTIGRRSMSLRLGTIARGVEEDRPGLKFVNVVVVVVVVAKLGPGAACK